MALVVVLTGESLALETGLEAVGDQAAYDLARVVLLE